MRNSAFKKLRTMKVYTLTELARALKVPVSTIVRWENREEQVPYMALLSIAGLKPKQKALEK